jgi:dihydropteroate synthase
MNRGAKQRFRAGMIDSPLKIQKYAFNWGERTYLMGTINVTADSFSGDGLLGREGSGRLISQAITAEMIEKLQQRALEQARGYISAGAHIIDVGGESTRPGSQPVPAEEELRRVIPVISTIASELDIVISIDTYKSEVAKAALEAGAHIVNDVWALRADPEMAGVVARFGAPVILMHNRSSWVHAEVKERLGGRYIGIEYQDLIGDISRELLESVEMAKSAGIPDEHILLDPGIGFGKTVEQNLELLDRLAEIRSLGYPVLVGPSRKSFIGYTLDAPPDQRLAGTAAAIAVGIVRGADVVRVHDVEFIAGVTRMTDAIVRR